MKKPNLTSVMTGKLFRIPDYQRGYAWEQPHWKDFIQDIDALIEEDIQSHYTGTLVIYQPPIPLCKRYGIDNIEIVEVVDGQQRLTTTSLYLSIVLNKLIALGKEEYKQALTTYLYCGTQSKLTLNNETNDIFYDLITTGSPKTRQTTIHQERLFEAYTYLKRGVERGLREKSASEQVAYLEKRYDAMTKRLFFSLYTIEEESEIGMTFELMNSRGKDLSVLELLKNYLMYWVYRNTSEPDRTDLTNTINKTWREVFANVAGCKGSESQCLRIAWILYVSHIPKNWNGYAGFKEKRVIPIRGFNSKEERDETQHFIQRFIGGLSEVSFHYNSLLSNISSKEEKRWVTKLMHAGNTANFLPLMVAAKSKLSSGKVTSSQYIELLKCLERYSYRVFLYNGRRRNAGVSSFYRWAYELYNDRQPIDSISSWVCDLCNYYLEEGRFRADVERTSDWYSYRNLLKYTLYEYEIALLEREGGIATPKIAWSDLTDATIEHILPQTPKGKWIEVWSEKERERYTHDISNLVLTFDNSHYSNFEFDRKRGSAGSDYCYANSDIRQERKIASYPTWDAHTCQQRKEELSAWIIKRWGMDRHFHEIAVNEVDDGDE